MISSGDIVFDRINKIPYITKKLLGKGGFAKCFELVDNNEASVAAKVIEKSDIKTSYHKSKLQQEIQIHMELDHKNIVKFMSYFDDSSNVYIVLELCTCQSLAELYRRRRKLLIPEVRYYSKQIIEACVYLHDLLIIHRDLKLQNVFLDGDLVVKLGDFGLATQLDHEEEKKKTMCGTPNYLAPEILKKNGHSFEVDVWSLGVIIYCLTIGKLPFETNSMKETYHAIAENQYSLPYNLAKDVKEVIDEVLASDANDRPTMKVLLQMRFYKGFIPTCLPKSALSAPPRFDNGEENDADEIHDVNNKAEIMTRNAYMDTLNKQIQEMLLEVNIIPVSKSNQDAMEESEDPRLTPIFWISKWMDFTNKFGLGYQLNDGSNGAFFNDKTMMVLATNNYNLQYIKENGNELFFTRKQTPESIQKKTEIVDYFKNYMNQNLEPAGAEMMNMEKEAMARLPYLKKWFRNNVAIILCLSNGTLQINFIQDHVKLILCPLMGSVSVLKSDSFKTYNFKSLDRNGMSLDLSKRLKYVVEIMEQIQE